MPHFFGMLHELSESEAAYERGEITQAERARELGISARWLRELERRDMDELDRLQMAAAAPGADDLPWVELTDRRKPGRPHYDLADDGLIKPPGPFRIADHHGHYLRVEHEGNGAPVEQPKKCGGKFKPKSRKKHR